MGLQDCSPVLQARFLQVLLELQETGEEVMVWSSQGKSVGVAHEVVFRILRQGRRSVHSAQDTQAVPAEKAKCLP